MNRCDAALPFTYYTPLLLLQLLCNHVAVVVSFLTNVALRVDRNNHHKNGIEFHFLMIQIPEKYSPKKEIMLSRRIVFDFKVIGDYRSVALTIKFDTMTRSILIH